MPSSNVANKLDHITNQFYGMTSPIEPQLRILNVGGLTTAIRSHDIGLLETFVSPFTHLLANVEDYLATAPPAITIDIALREDLVDPSNPIWPWELDHYQDQHGIVQFFPMSDAILIFDYSSSRILLIFDTLPESKWRRPECSRPIIERIFSPYGMASVHGGTLGRDGRCVLITAKGGSGKSSLITAGVTRGLQTIGDDFQFLGRSPEDPDSLQLSSLYYSVKLGADSPAWNYLGLSPEENPALPGMDKSLLNLLDLYPECVVASQQPVAIVVPKLGTTGGLVSISVEETLTALLPTSVGMSTRKHESILALKGLVERVPCYSLTVSRNLDLAIDELTRMLNAHSEKIP